MAQVKVGDKNIEMKRVTDLTIYDVLITRNRHPIAIDTIENKCSDRICNLVTGNSVVFRNDSWVKTLRKVSAQQAFAAEASSRHGQRETTQTAE